MSNSIETGLPGLDLDRFSRWYNLQCPSDLNGDLSGNLIAGGKSNLTYAVSDGVTTRIVRRPPLGHVQATAHDMSREFTVLRALRVSKVPVPETFAVCTDANIIGAPFFVMEYIPGTAYRRAEQLAPLGPDRVHSVTLDMIDVLADLHAVDPESVGLGMFGRPDGFLTRQVRRWARQLDGSRSRPLPDADALLRWLLENVESRDLPGETSIVHGDYRMNNLLVDGDQISAVIDWEMATLGDPLTDLALLFVYDSLPLIAPGSTDATASMALGYPSMNEQLSRYEAASGRTLGNLDFHLALAHFKLAVILEGVHYRYLQGQTLGTGFATVGDSVRPLLAAGLAATGSSEGKPRGL